MSTAPIPTPESAAAQESAPLKSLADIKWWQRFHVRLTLLNGLVLVFLLGGVGVVFYEFAYHSEFKALRQRIRSTVDFLSRNIEVTAYEDVIRDPTIDKPGYKVLKARFKAILASDPAATSVYILAMADPGGAPASLITVVDASSEYKPELPGALYDASELPVMQRGLLETAVEERMYEDQWGYSLSGYAPIRAPDGTPLALVGFDVKATYVREISYRVLTVVAIIVGVALMVLILFAMILGRRIRKPIEAMSQAADRIADGDFDIRLTIERRDEFGLMANHLSVIARNLRERDLLRDTFGRYVSPDIARRLLADRSAGALGGEDREVTVVFSDIEGYSTMTEMVSPQEVVGLLNAYLGSMNEVIDRYEGCIIEIIGDAILAVFNAPNDLDKHEEAAVRCALDMRVALEKLNEDWADSPIALIWTQAGKSELRARVGIHSGHVVAGNIGSKTRMKYGIIGDVVNVAARIEALNKTLKTNLLISDATWTALPAELQAKGTPEGAHNVKGRGDAVTVYRY